MQVGSSRPRHWSEPCVITRQRRQEPEDRAGEMQFTRGGAVRHSPQISSRRADFPPLIFLKGRQRRRRLAARPSARPRGRGHPRRSRQTGTSEARPALDRPNGLGRWHRHNHVLQCHHCLWQAPWLVDFAPASPQAFFKSPFAGGASLRRTELFGVVLLR